MSDNYEFEKSSRPQDIDDYSPYTDKQYNGFINDLNWGAYTNTSLSLVQFDGKTVESTQSFVNVAKNFQMMSEMSTNDLATIGYTLGFGETLDNPRSAKWCGGTAAQVVGLPIILL